MVSEELAIAIKYSDIIDILLTRAERLGLVSVGEQKADTAELENYMFQALLDITETVDIPAFTQHDDNMAVTHTGQAAYILPIAFGRLILPRVRNRRGIYLYDTIQNVDLEYLDPNAFSRKTSLVTARPHSFTVMQRNLWLFPTPDSNSTNDYRIRGAYIQTIERPDLDDNVPFSYPTALVDSVLFRLAGDMGKQIEAVTILGNIRTASMKRLAAGSR